MATESDAQGLIHWFCGALFIPSLALILGTISRTHRLFQFAYVSLWYGTVNGIAPIDFMGAVRADDGSPAGISPALPLAAVAVMVGALFVPGVARRATA